MKEDSEKDSESQMTLGSESQRVGAAIEETIVCVADPLVLVRLSQRLLKVIWTTFIPPGQ